MRPNPAPKLAKFQKRPSNNPEGFSGGGQKKGSLRTREYLKQAAERNVRKKKKNRRKTNERKKEKRREKVDAELQLNWAASKAYMGAQLPALRAAHQFDIRAVWRSKSDRDDPSGGLRSVLPERQITKLLSQLLKCGEGNESILTSPLHHRGTRDEALTHSKHFGRNGIVGAAKSAAPFWPPPLLLVSGAPAAAVAGVGCCGCCRC
jgi:hypothetical protein